MDFRGKGQRLFDMGIDQETVRFCEETEQSLTSQFTRIEQILEENQWKVLGAMQDQRVAPMHFEASTGYGYNDVGRDCLEAVYAKVFAGEDALVRPQMISGTHALSTALFACLRPGDELISAVGAPYDTLQGVIGIRPEVGSLAEMGVRYEQVELGRDGRPDVAGIARAVKASTRMVTIQRSKGYSFRHSLSIGEIGEIIRAVKSANPDCICMVDNCYGEFVEDQEPCEVGADSDSRLADQKSRWGAGAHRGIYCGAQRFDPTVRRPVISSRAWKGSWRHTGSEPVPLSRAVLSAPGDSRGGENGRLCLRPVSAAWISGFTGAGREPP